MIMLFSESTKGASDDQLNNLCAKLNDKYSSNLTTR